VSQPRPADTGNRAFWSLVAVWFLLRAALAYGTCCLILAIADAVRAARAHALWSGHPNLLPGLLLLAVIAAGTGRAAWSLARSARQTVGFARQIRGHRTTASPRVVAAAGRGGIGHGRLVVLGASSPFAALTYGIVRPRVLIAAGSQPRSPTPSWPLY